MCRFSGKRAVVIGGTGDIGFAICKKLIHEGAFVTVHCSAESEKSKKIEKEFASNVELLNFNISEDNFDAIDESILKERVSEADILCVVMGPFAQKSIESTGLKDWKKFALLDYALPGLLSSYAIPYMKEKKWGRIILFGGTRTFSINAYRTNAAYAAAKTAVSVITKSIAVECAPYNITCNAILPGFVDSKNMDNLTRKMLIEKTPNKCLISPDEIADAVIFLISGNNINGVLFNLDSGWNP